MAILKNREYLNAGGLRFGIYLPDLRRPHEGRLFDDDVLPIAGNNIERVLIMHAGWRSDGDGIDLWIFREHLVIIVVCLGTELFAIQISFFNREIAYCDQLGSLGLDDRTAMMS